jgi:hypothetical protein
MNEPSIAIVQVTYMELRGSPAPPADRCGSELIARKHPSLRDYLTLYRNVGEPLRWDQGLLMPEAELRALLGGKALNILCIARPTTQRSRALRVRPQRVSGDRAQPFLV